MYVFYPLITVRNLICKLYNITYMALFFTKKKYISEQKQFIYFGQIILFIFKSNHSGTYFLYMMRYNNISRPVHDPNEPPATLPATSTRPPCPKYGGRDPQPPGLTTLDSNEKEAFSRRNGLPREGLRSMKIRIVKILI